VDRRDASSRPTGTDMRPIFAVSIAALAGTLVGIAIESRVQWTDATARANELKAAPSLAGSKPAGIVQEQGSTADIGRRQPLLQSSGAAAPNETDRQSSLSIVSSSPDEPTLRALDSALAHLNNATPGEQLAAVQQVLLHSISIIMDKAGTAIPIPEGPSKWPLQKGWQIFEENGKWYKFPKGEFPEYDQWYSAFASSSRNLHPQLRGSVPPGGELAWPLEHEVVDQVRARAEEARTLLTWGSNR
jgi:hypothetical protein